MDEELRELVVRLEQQEAQLQAQAAELASLRAASGATRIDGDGDGASMAWTEGAAGRVPHRRGGPTGHRSGTGASSGGEVTPTGALPGPVDPSATDGPTRRGLLRSLGAAAAGAAGATAAGLVAAAQPAAAANGDPIRAGQETGISPGTAAPTVLNVVGGGFRPDSRSAFIVTDGQDPGALGAAIQGLASLALSDGVAGVSVSGAGVVGYAPTTGYSLYAAGGGGVAIEPSAATGPPLGGWSAGDLATTEDGALWANVGGTSPWRKLAAPTTAGSFHLLDPVRIFDTRAGTWNRKLRSGERIILGVSTAQSFAATGIPNDATAVTFNLTLDQTEGSGFASVYPNDIAFPGTSTANWSAPGATVANGGVTRLARATAAVWPDGPIPPTSGPSLAIQAGGGGATHVILDVTGYYR